MNAIGQSGRGARYALTAAALLAGPEIASADEGGVGFWLPGQFGSFIATPVAPGRSLPVLTYYSEAQEDGNRLFPRGGRITAGVNAYTSLLFLSPTYTFTTPLAGAQAAVSLGGALGHVNVGVSATLSAPGGSEVSGVERDSLTGVSDLYPLFTLKWNRGVHNWMAYTMWGLPVGDYDVDRLANLGTNHWSADFGGGYTYLDEKAGQEFSASLGLTWNFENYATHYRNGTDAHLDIAASKIVSPKFHAGVVGYAYQQLSGDSGSGATLGAFKSQVFGFGPQAGWFFKVGQAQWYLNLKGYYEWDSDNRPEGWNVWLTVDIPLTVTAH